MSRLLCRGAIVVLFCLAGVGPVAAQVLNEIRTNNSGTDINEYVEIAGAPGSALGNLHVIALGDDVEGTSGSSGVVEEVVALSGTIDGSGYFVIAEASLTLGTADLIADLSFEEDDNVTFLLVRGFTGALGDDLDTNDDGVLDVTPWTAIVDRIAIIEQENPPQRTEFHYGPPVVGPNGVFVPAHVYRCPDGDAGGDFQIGQFDTNGGQDTAGAENTPCPAAPPPPDAGVPANPDAGVPGDAGADTDAGPGSDRDGGPIDMADASPGSPDAGPGSPPDDAGSDGDDMDSASDGGCCNVSGEMPASNLLLVLIVGAMLLARRRSRHLS